MQKLQQIVTISNTIGLASWLCMLQSSALKAGGHMQS